MNVLEAHYLPQLWVVMHCIYINNNRGSLGDYKIIILNVLK